MFRQPDSLYAGVLLCSAIILAVVGGPLFWLRMPGDERLRNYRLSRRFVGWAYFSLAFTDVLWLLFLREEYELDFTRILVLAVAAVQATMFSGALVTLVNSRFPLARGVRRHLLAVAAGTASLFGCMLFFPQAFPVLFRLNGRQEMHFPMFLDCKLCWVPLYLALSLLSRDKTHKKLIGA